MSEVVTFCLGSLDEIRSCYPIASRLQAMFGQSLRELGVDLSEQQEQLLAASGQMTLNDLLDACTRPTYKQPTLQILSNMEEGLAQDVMDQWGGRRFSSSSVVATRGGRSGEDRESSHPRGGQAPGGGKGPTGGRGGGAGGSSGGTSKGKGKKMDISNMLNR